MKCSNCSSRNIAFTAGYFCEDCGEFQEDHVESEKATGIFVSTKADVPDDDRHVVIIDHRGNVLWGWYGKHRGRNRWFYDDGTLARVKYWLDLPVLPSGRKAQRAGIFYEKGKPE